MELIDRYVAEVGRHLHKRSTRSAGQARRSRLLWGWSLSFFSPCCLNSFRRFFQPICRFTSARFWCSIYRYWYFPFFSMQIYRMVFIVALLATLVDTAQVGWRLIKSLFERSSVPSFPSGTPSAG